MKHGIGVELILAPELLTRRGVEAGNHAAHAERDDLAVRDGGRTARPGMLRGATTGAQRFVFVLPDFLAIGGHQAARDLTPLLAGKNVKLVADQSWRRHAFADGDLPLLCEFLRP